MPMAELHLGASGPTTWDAIKQLDRSNSIFVEDLYSSSDNLLSDLDTAVRNNEVLSRRHTDSLVFLASSGE